MLIEIRVSCGYVQELLWVEIFCIRVWRRDKDLINRRKVVCFSKPFIDATKSEVKQ